MEVDKDKDGMAVGEFLRIKVILDIRKPLFRGITIEGEGWCNIKYEFLPNFCYVCGHLGHVEEECDEGDWQEERRQFGELMTRIILETDASNLHKGLTSDELDRSLEGPLFRQIRDFIAHNFVHCMVRTCLRSCNKVADSLHGASVVRSGSMVFMDQVPEFVTNLVYGDLPRESGLMQIGP